MRDGLNVGIAIMCMIIFWPFFALWAIYGFWSRNNNDSFQDKVKLTLLALLSIYIYWFLLKVLSYLF